MNNFIEKITTALQKYHTRLQSSDLSKIECMDLCIQSIQKAIREELPKPLGDKYLEIANRVGNVGDAIQYMYGHNDFRRVTLRNLGITNDKCEDIETKENKHNDKKVRKDDKGTKRNC